MGGSTFQAEGKVSAEVLSEECIQASMHSVNTTKDGEAKLELPRGEK